MNITFYPSVLITDNVRRLKNSVSSFEWRNMVRLCLPLMLIVLAFGVTPAQAEVLGSTNSITQWGITWTFDKEYEYGQFVNDDYWVKGPITIIRIEPDFDGTGNGWEVNPLVGTQHGFDTRCKGGGFTASKVPGLPYTTTNPIESIVKVISTGQNQPCVKTAAVLTVIDQIPPDGGDAVFRPPYVGTEKPLYRVSDLRFDLLPSYAPVGNPPTLAEAADNFRYFRMEHLTSGALRSCRPADAMLNYNPKNQPKNHETLLTLMLNYSLQEKMPVLIRYMQHGIDKSHAILDGWVLPGADGHDPGHRIIAAFAATMLDLDDVKSVLNSATRFHEDYFLVQGINGQSLWGEPSTEGQYWYYVMGQGGSRSRKDPYGYIDGGKCGAEYQLITSQSHKGSILATYLMPSLQGAWNPTTWAITAHYVDRWVEAGTWSQPDPCAPFDGNVNNYKITYGPDGSGGCIQDTNPDDGIGRFPEKQGSSQDGGQYRSAFVAAMWDAYRDSPTPPNQNAPTQPTNLRVK
jgi:hypothetical protein